MIPGDAPTPPSPPEAGDPPPSTRARGRRGYLLPGFIALVALLVIGLVVGAGGDLTHPAPKALHGPDVALQIALSIQAQENTRQPPTVRCPNLEPVQTGRRFTCTLTRSGATETIQITEIDGRGHLRWALGQSGP